VAILIINNGNSQPAERKCDYTYIEKRIFLWHTGENTRGGGGGAAVRKLTHMAGYMRPGLEKETEEMTKWYSEMKY